MDGLVKKCNDFECTYFMDEPTAVNAVKKEEAEEDGIVIEMIEATRKFGIGR